MTAPFFSVVIPVFNRATELRAAIGSVLAQAEQDFEIVVVDDGSRDGPERTIGEFADPRIVLIRQDNKGGAAARNRGIDAARGRFVAFLDSDDQFLPDHLAAMRRLVEGKEKVAAYARVIVERGAGKTFLKPPRAIAPDEHMATYLLCERGFVPTITLVVETTLARQVRYDERLAFAQDTDFSIRLYLAGCRFLMAEQPGAIWNDSGDARRVSAGRKGARMRAWLEEMKTRIPPRAYHGARGWMIAKGVVRTHPVAALKLWAGAVARGSYAPRLAAVVFLQIFFPDRFYRSLVDAVVRLFGTAVWSDSERTSPGAARARVS